MEWPYERLCGQGGLPHLSGLPHLPEVPLRHVNKPKEINFYSWWHISRVNAWIDRCQWLAPVRIWRAANQGVTRLGSRGNMELFLILWRSRYNMTTRSRPGRGETGKKLIKGSQAMSVTREETGGSTQRMGGCNPDIWNFYSYSQSSPVQEKSYKQVYPSCEYLTRKRPRRLTRKEEKTHLFRLRHGVELRNGRSQCKL